MEISLKVGPLELALQTRLSDPLREAELQKDSVGKAIEAMAPALFSVLSQAFRPPPPPPPTRPMDDYEPPQNEPGMCEDEEEGMS